MQLNFRPILFFVLLLSASVHAQVKLPEWDDQVFGTYYCQRVSHFDQLPVKNTDIIFIGNSITEGAEWDELFSDVNIRSRGISGDISAGVLNRISKIGKGRPDKIFLLIGTNDLSRGISTDSVVRNILWLADWLRQESPDTKFFVQSILPVSDQFKKFSGHSSKTDSILKVNERLKREAVSHHYKFIDLHSYFCNAQGKLDEKYTNDGLHLLGDGYLLWKHLVFPFVYGLEQKPSLIPLPQKLEWKTGYFPLLECKSIVVSGEGIDKEAEALKKIIEESGGTVLIKKKAEKQDRLIELKLVPATFPAGSKEHYHLEVSSERILLTAETALGIYYGIQTIRQLMRSGVMIDACEITDWPAFSWRAYMIDAGRNYMSVKALKEQIDVMSRYKMNVFHFHATEDIAWRIAIKQFPQLTAPENMLRNKGMYYTEAEIKEMITYCKERHIQFVPEIDMPGHSAAFKRAMKTDMQSDSGIQYVKAILKEICSVYDIDFIHIGADEVKITNKNFIPEISAFIDSLGKKIIGWQPGGNFTDNTLRQLWLEDKAHLTSGKNIRYIDSRHLYLNHMDPQESVVTIFNRSICVKQKGDSLALGATLCMWHDRAVSREEDILRMNPVYPGMLAFSERTWRGGGQKNWISNIDEGDKAAFIQFEGRVMDHKQIYFKNKAFPYSRQSGISWKLYGPYPNEGELSKIFEPEKADWIAPSSAAKTVTGGTIVLRHWWAPMIKGALDDPKENSTWYASSSYWSEVDTIKNFRIGFYNISRSQASDSPPVGKWDQKGSQVWVNGNLIPPPVWKRGGQKGNSEIPLIDEGYEYREATRIQLKKGVNTILIKLPVGSFKGKEWQNPVKWMFTFVEADN